MQVICGSLAALCVAALYYLWRAYAHGRRRRERARCERVAYLLWVVAQQAP